MRAAMEDTAEGIRGGTPGPRTRKFEEDLMLSRHRARIVAGYKRRAVGPRVEGEPVLYTDVCMNTTFAWNSGMMVRDAFVMHLCKPANGGAGAAFVRNVFPFNTPGTSVIGLPTIRYIEVTLGREVKSPQVGLGIVSNRTAMKMLRGGLPLGWYSGPWEGSFQAMALHTNGRIFPGANDTRWFSGGDKLSAPFQAGDVMGCGMDLAQGRVIFTRNGQVIAHIVPSKRRATVEEIHNDVEHWLDDDAPTADLLERLVTGRRRSHDVGLGNLAATFSQGTALQSMLSINVPNSVFAITLEGESCVRVNLGQEPFVFDLGKHLDSRENQGQPDFKVQSVFATMHGEMGHTRSFGGYSALSSGHGEDSLHGNDNDNDVDGDDHDAANLICQLSFAVCDPTGESKLAWLGM